MYIHVCIPGEDFDELEVYGSGHSSVPTLASFKFEVFDSILNIGPITNLTISQPAFLSVSVCVCACVHVCVRK